MKEKVEKTRQHNSGNGIGVRIVAGILAFLMVASLAFTVVAYLIKWKFIGNFYNKLNKKQSLNFTNLN